MSDWIGRTLGKVHIDKLLARGGMAEVYIGTHTTLQREVAVKILRNNYDEQPHALERFQREAMVVGKLRHPNIVQVFDFDTTTDSQPYLVMEYIKGPSLQTYLNGLHAKSEFLDFSHVVRLMDSMTSALQYAHDNGVIHRDIKPGNILLTSRSGQVTAGKPLPEDFEPVLTDFGLVRFLDSTMHTTGSGQIAGTPAYMSPEQARGELTDGRTDIYSLGIVLYEILAGHLPFEGETTMGVLMRHISEPPAPVPGLPPTMQMVLDRALAKDLDERFQSPAEFGEAFSAAVENKTDYSTIEFGGPPPTKSTKKKPAVKPLQRAKKRRSFIPAALAGVFTVALGALVVFNVYSPTPEPTPTTTSVPPTGTSMGLSIPILGKAATLTFTDGDGIADQAVLTASALPSAPAGTEYEVWLIGTEDRQSLGILKVNASGQGTLTFKDDQAANMVALYDQIEITTEPIPDPDPAVSGPVAYSFALPATGLTHVRYLLSAYPGTPKNVGLVHGTLGTIQIVNEAVHDMQDAYAGGDRPGVIQFAELAMNVLVGKQSPDYKDWNNDGETANTFDGYGLMLNGSSLGYIQALYTEADAAASAPGATQDMITQGENVKTCTQNFAFWAPQLRDLLMTILTSSSDADISLPVRNAVILADKMLNGMDLNENNRIEPLAEECGALAAYDAAYHMADMILLPAGVIPTVVTTTPNPTATMTPTVQYVTPTKTPGAGGGSGGSSGGSGNTAPTKKPKPTQKPKPDNNNGNNN